MTQKERRIVREGVCSKLFCGVDFPKLLKEENRKGRKRQREIDIMLFTRLILNRMRKYLYCVCDDTYGCSDAGYCVAFKHTKEFKKLLNELKELGGVK